MLFLLISLGFSGTFGPFIKDITSSNFQHEIEERNNRTVYFVMFHGQNCPACQMAYPEFRDAANEANGMIKFGHVDTNYEQELAFQFRIYAIPAFFVFYPGGVARYERERYSRTMLNVVSRYIPNYAETVDESWLEEKTEDKRQAILFSNKNEVPPIWAGISSTFFDRTPKIRIGFCNNDTITKKFGVSKVPTIVFINGENMTVYNDKIRFGSLKSALVRSLISTDDQKSPENEENDQKTSETVGKLNTRTEFDEICQGKGIYCVLQKGEKATAEFQEVAEAKSNNKRLQFFTCGEKCQIDGFESGIMIFHNKRFEAIRIDDIKSLATTLDRVIDGGARFHSIDDLRSTKEL
ncbi:Thioredoxin family protein [Tritrichomonas foetus]|uniref:Thioredoxin family protein n=1 Tax=Tritrichomonas foetus TaxID=1144522 RepID=A0A1J4JBX9_9EUKA|nr:Thioredoxin family protein [Tritrichomonas foetus]|eukprot:OHS96706.1 Thioredoxin family protein [Tritrichomonas foetus]